MKVTQEDYNAGLLALQVYDRIHTRTPFGRTTTLVENARWNNGRKVLAYYNADLAINESWKKKNIENYINDAGQFLNSLNESYHKDGYHIGMTGTTEGTIYVGKDNINDPYEFNNSEGEYMYEQECAYRQYLINKANCQKQLKGMITEAAILSNDQLGIVERIDAVYSINEGLGDSISDGWNKFKAFMQKIWNKFLEFIARTINTDKGYLDKYKDIIIHRKWKGDGTITTDAQYSVGITRLAQFTVSTPTVDNIKTPLTKNEDTDLKNMQGILMPEFRSKGANTDFKDFCKHWFKGGDGKAGTYDMSEGELNFTDMFNWCYNYDKVKKTLEKNYGVMSNAITVFQNAAKDVIQGQQAQGQPQGQGQGQGQGKGKAQPPPQQQTTFSKGGSIPAKGFAVAQGTEMNGNDTYIEFSVDGKVQKVKVDPPKNNGQGSSRPEIKNRGLAGKVGLLKQAKSKQEFDSILSESKISLNCSLGHIILEDITYNSKPGSGSTNNAGNQLNNLNQKNGSVRVANDTSGRLAGSGLTEEDLNKKMSYYQSASSDIFSAMLTAAETIKKDYMKLIKKHVQSYIGEDKDSENKIAQRAGSDNSVSINYDKHIAKWFDAQGNLKPGTELANLQNKENNNPDDAAKAEINQFLHDVSQSPDHKTPQGTVSRTYGTIAEYIEAMQSYREMKNQQNQQQQQPQGQGQGQQQQQQRSGGYIT